MGKKILFLVPYPLHQSPSQRFRFEQYFTVLKEKGFVYSTQSFLDIDHWKVFYKSGRTLKKGFALISGFAKRLIALFKSPMYDFVFIHREVTPIGPPLFEWILAKILRKKIIYDFDDAIWLTDRERESWILKLAKWRGKVSLISKWSYKVSCGNQYLCNYVSRFNKRAVYNPTTIDTEFLHNPSLTKFLNRPSEKIKIGWTGSHSTLKYLTEIESVLATILTTYRNVELIVIADKEPVFTLIPRVTFMPWNSDTEIDDLMQFDIGVMPLPDDRWAQGKCGFKALQYMALEVPAIASPVGVNSEIIDHGINGYLCSSKEAWENALKTLIESPTLRKKMGINGRRKVIKDYSILSNSPTFLSLFER